MAYASWSVVFGEQPSAAKWNILGTNDAHFYTYTGEGTNAIQQFVYTESGAVATTTTTIPNDDTIPQITEGGLFLTRAITPKSATNVLKFEVDLIGASTVSDVVTVALFQDSTANAIAASAVWQQTGGGVFQHTLQHMMVSGTTSSTSFTVRAGIASAGTFTLNGAASARKYGGVAASSIAITEFKV